MAQPNIKATSFHMQDIQSLKGSFLIASPLIPDARFKQTIIFICESKNSTFGFIIDPSEKNTTSKFKKKFKNTILQGVPVYLGGPVDESKLFLVHSHDALWPESLKIENLAITTINDVLRKQDRLPKDYMIIAGYANWMHMQLERELSLGFWVVSNNDSAVIFDKTIKNRWKYCMDKLQLNANTFAHYVGTT